MPTTRPRHQVTETDDVRDALDRAARHYPHLRANRKALLLELLATGDAALRDREGAGDRTDDQRLEYLLDASQRRIDAIDWAVLSALDDLAWRAG